MIEISIGLGIVFSLILSEILGEKYSRLNQKLFD